MRFLLVAACILSCESITAQSVFGSDTSGIKTLSDNVYNRRISGDSLATSFCIVIKKEVKPHRHLMHSENVIVMEGEGKMRLGSETVFIHKGDVIFIPKNTLHSATSTGKVPLKVISIQSPAFDGTDRVFGE